MDIIYKFSVIIPTYNRADLLERCLDSLSKQTYKNFEVLVCDDGSTDNSAEIANRFINKLNLKYLWAENWGGPARPRNRGVYEAKGEWICFLDSDDWWTSDKLSTCLPYLDDFDFLYHDLFMCNSKGSIRSRKIRGRKLEEDITRDLIVNGNGIPNSSVVVRRELMLKINGFSENRELIAVEDSDCWLRLAEITKSFKYISSCLGYYWIGDNVSVSIKQIERENELLNQHIYKVSVKDQKRALKSMSYKQARIYHKLGMMKEARVKYINSCDLNKKRRHVSLIFLYLMTCFKIKV